MVTNECSITTPPPRPVVSGGAATYADIRSGSLLEVARLRLLDARTIAEQHQPGRWESLERERSELTKFISEIISRMNDLSTRRDVIVGEISALKKQKHDLSCAVLARSNTLISRFKRLIGVDLILEELHGKVDERIKAITEGSTAIERVARERSEAQRQLDNLPDPNRAISRFADEIVLTRLSEEERRDLLRPEVLQSLSLEEYAQVWRRINPYFVSHVTRQGVRDHNAMVYHSAGMHQYQNGLGAILGDGRELRAPRVVQDALDPTCRKSIERFLTEKGVLAEPTLDAALKLFDDLVHRTIASAPKYADSGAIHFAAEKVADSYYGAETGNEIFVIYPSDLIATQYCFAFNGGSSDFTRPQSEDKWNDLFVWDPERVQTAIPLDAGVVFLPRSTMVDRVTGSRYALDGVEVDGVTQYTPARYPDFDRRFATWRMAIPTDSDFTQALLHRSSLAEKRSTTQDPRESRELTLEIERALELLKQAIYRSLQELEIPADIAEQMSEKLLKISETMHLNIPLCKAVRCGKATFSFEQVEGESRFDYLRPAIDPIPAMEYWESHFNREPHLRPRHIVYYDGTPTDAVKKFLADHNISESASSFSTDYRQASDQKDRLLGFETNHITDMSRDPRANRGLEELERLGRELIAEKFGETHLE